MKNYLKFIIATMIFAFVTVSATQKVSAKAGVSTGSCSGAGCCGTTSAGNDIEGTFSGPCITTSTIK